MSLRERLLDRPRPSGEVPLRVDDDTEAREDLERARRVLFMLQIEGGADKAFQRARTALTRAEKKLRSCFEFVTVRALDPGDFEALVTVHPPRPDTKDKLWNLDTFPKACFLACVEGDMTPQEWEHLWETGLSNAEQIELGNAAIRVNIRTPDESLPKGWAQIEG